MEVVNTPLTHDLPKPPEHSIRWYEDLCFKNSGSAQTEKGRSDWSEKLSVPQDIRTAFQEKFNQRSFGDPYYTKHAPDQEKGLLADVDGKTPGDISKEAERIINRLESSLSSGEVTEEIDREMTERKINAARQVSQYFEQESLRRK
jgi:hypothetical protein